jgi:hypothetical protein
MVRKSLIFLVLSAFVIALSGCHTIYGGAKGAKEGVKKDVEAVKKSDKWLHDNLW